jgi:hypothetical protein
VPNVRQCSAARAFREAPAVAALPEVPGEGYSAGAFGGRMNANPYQPDEYGGGRKLCPNCEAPIAERQQTCAECYDPDEQCACGALTEMGPYGVRYGCCDDCADVRE